jgi:phosphate transport system substrate-binding protein
MTFGSLQNRSGRFIAPSVKSVTAAASIDLSARNDYSLTDTMVADGYPISGFTWITLYREQNYARRSRETAENLVNLLAFVIHDGQKQAPLLHYAPLPKSVRRSANRLLGMVTHSGIPVYKNKK